MNSLFLKRTIPLLSISTILLSASFSPAPAQQPRQLSFAERVAYQYAIEEVYWRHRIWPKENLGPKPSLDEVMTAAQIEKKVEEYLRNSQLLADYWQRPITPEQLQAEMERVASQTKQPEVLQELFAALGNDSFLVAECLARPVLSERLVKQLYAHDEGIHGELKRRAESELHACQSVEQVKQTSGTYSELEWIRSDDQLGSADIDNGTVGHAHRLPVSDSAGGAPALQRPDEPNAIRMTPSEWQQRVQKLAAMFGKGSLVGAVDLNRPGGSGELPLPEKTAGLSQIRTGTSSPLQEDEDHYYVTAVLKKSKDRLRVATVAWPKEPFESWAAEVNAEMPDATDDPAADYALPAIASSPANPWTSCSDNSWVPTELVYDYPAARAHHTAVWTGTEMILWGGYSFDPLNTGSRYNPSTNSWVPTSSTNAPTARYEHTAVWTGSEMILWGGRTQTISLNSGGRYNPTTDTWTATSSTNVPSARYAHTAVWTGSEMIIWGSFSDGARYSPIADTWVPTSNINAPAGRSYHTAVWTGSEMIIWGGNHLNTGGRYNPNTNSWVATNTTNAPAARDSHTAVWTGTEVIIWGGLGGLYLNSGGRYNPITNSWVATSSTNAPSVRGYHAAVWTGSEMLVWGGYNNGTPLDTGGRYDPSTDSWTTVTTANAPTARGFHPAVWTGSEMIVWGGTQDSGSSAFDTGGRYDPSTNSWIRLYSTNTPPGRYPYVAIWTGSEMIVWPQGATYNPSTGGWRAISTVNATGGRNLTAVWTGNEMILWGGYLGAAGYQPVGSRYNPTTDSWIPTTTNNAPIGRELHTAIWSGSEMIIWGGWASSGGYFNSGGRYNPSTDSWAAVSINNVPTARRRHTAVWTGTEMIAWGGYNSSSVALNTGGRYNPATDSWTATSTDANAPSARGLLVAVWTGSQMIVWGGSNGSIDLNTGGRYNPTTDSWLATSSTNAPLARDTHTAIWTGYEMIVWGGEFYDGTIHFLNTGGKYDPSIDGWVATTMTSAPSARAAHSALWTGSEMIVWGGTDGNTSFNTGGRYCASSAPVAQSAVSRKVHGLSGTFDVDLPLTGTPGIECRTGGTTNDYSIVVTFASAVTVNGSPQTQVTAGTATVGSGGVSNGGMVTISGNSVTVPLTNVANAQTINVRLNGVTGSSGSGNITAQMSILVGDTNANGAVNSGDVAQTKARLGQTLDATNFRSDVNANGAINAGDVSQIKSLLGTGLP